MAPRLRFSISHRARLAAPARRARLAAPARLALAGVAALLALGGCGGGDADAPPDARTIKGCPVLAEPQAAPGDPIDGDRWDSFATGFFAQHCTRCHSSTLSGPDRQGAPIDYDWDVEAAVRAHLPEIRNAVGVTMFMPLSPPDPTCQERQQLVRWIDADAP